MQRDLLLVAGVGTSPWRFSLANSSDQEIRLDCSPHTCALGNSPTAAAEPSLFLHSPFLVPHVCSQMQHFPANAVHVDETVAEPESLKKLLIIWLMRIGLWECEINHQPWAELLKWILVFCLLSLGNGLSFLCHQVNRCRDAVFSFSQSQEQPVARRGLFFSPAARAVCNMGSYALRMFRLLETVPTWQVPPHLFQRPKCTRVCAHVPPAYVHGHTHMQAVLNVHKT